MTTLRRKGNWWFDMRLGQMKMAFEAGVGMGAVRETVRLCHELGRPLPDWAAQSLLTNLAPLPGSSNAPDIEPHMMQCATCGDTVHRVTRNQKYCPDCRARATAKYYYANVHERVRRPS